MTPLDQYDAMPLETKVLLLERSIAIALKALKDIDHNIKHFGLMEKGSMAHTDFYNAYNALFQTGSDDQSKTH